MAHEQQPQPALVAQSLDELEGPDLDRGIQTARRLVEQEEARSDRQRTGDNGALALAARDLVGMAPSKRGRQAYLVEQSLHDRRGVTRGTASGTLAFCDCRPDRLAWIERTVHVLLDGLDGASECTCGGTSEPLERHAAELHRSGTWPYDPEERPERGGLA
jgi:hypothetical protein